MEADDALTIVPASMDLLRQGVRVFDRRLDKQWSLTDCISFVVMKSFDLNEALTADHHFAQAGFDILLKK